MIHNKGMIHWQFLLFDASKKPLPMNNEHIFIQKFKAKLAIKSFVNHTLSTKML